MSMTLHATNGNRHEAIALARVLGVGAARSMTGFALNICKLGSGIDCLEPTLFVSNHVAFDATLVELLVSRLERGHCVCVAGVLPDVVFGLMALGALINADVGRRRAEKTER